MSGPAYRFGSGPPSVTRRLMPHRQNYANQLEEIQTDPLPQFGCSSAGGQFCVILDPPMLSTAFINSKTVNGFSLKLWRGERMVLLGMDVDKSEPDFVGFAIEVQRPGGNGFMTLRNRLAFSYGNAAAADAVNGQRNFSSLDAPFQKFRWIHFPYQPQPGSYTYRVTKRHMSDDGSLHSGTAITLDILLDPVIYDGF